MEKYKTYSYNLRLYGINIFTIVYDNIGGWFRLFGYGLTWTKKTIILNKKWVSQEFKN